ncbi:hypothetical protein ACB092_07G192100 [Castanea dentata]
MKLTWKTNNNKSSKKRPVPTTSNFRNLPSDFDQQKTKTNPLNEELASIDSSDSSNTKQLALSFQAQGDKLAKCEGDTLVHSLCTLVPPSFFIIIYLKKGRETKIFIEIEIRWFIHFIMRKALGKWEAALTLIPENAVLHEQKAQVLLEIGDS